MSADEPSTTGPDDAKGDESETEREMAEADEANGEGSAAVNDTEARYGEDESPA